jgi:hypothetical protein
VNQRRNGRWFHRPVGVVWRRLLFRVVWRSHRVFVIRDYRDRDPDGLEVQ